jgi:hypothetical protein
MAYPVLAELKTFMGIAGATYDTNLTTALAAAIKDIELYCGRVFVAASAAKEFAIAWPYVGKRRDRLNTFAEFTAVTTLVNGDGTTIASGDYTLYPTAAPHYMITLNPDSGLFFWNGGDSTPITLTADWGYSADVADDLERAILLTAQQFYYESVQGEEVLTMRPSVRRVLDRYKRGVL